MRLCASTLALLLALVACRQAPPPPSPRPAPAPVQPPVTPQAPLPPREPTERERGVTRRTLPGEKPIQQVMPFFSKPRAGQSRCNAWVVVSFTIAPSGSVESPAVERRCPEKDNQMDSAALAAVRQWRYAERSEPTPSRVSFDYQTEVPCDCPPAAP